jgi:LAS superfamily LD-carboxypeptidase LdcB
MMLREPYGISELGLERIFPENLLVAKEIIEDLERLKKSALQAGFSLKVESAFRSFEKQLSIWNRKAFGELPLLDKNGEVIQKLPENETEMMYCILFWSALPGCSRHHFGTDIDVSDASAVSENYEVQLTPQECNGVFAPFHEWLSECIASGKSFGFNRIFEPGRGKIQPEKWHLSHLPTARKIQDSFSIDTLKAIYEKTDIACKNAIIENLEKLLDEYVYPYFI